MDNVQKQTIQVLGNGFVSLIDYCGSDLSVVNAARVSMGKRHEIFTPEDEKLIQYLVQNKHTSPFRHAFLSFHVKCPLFVKGQFDKHQVGCLTGDTKLQFLNCENEVNATRTIKEIYDLWTLGQVNGTLPDESKIQQAKQLLSIHTPVNSIVKLTGIHRNTILKVRNNTYSEYRNAKSRVKQMKLRNLNEDNKYYDYTTIKDIIYTGNKDVFKVKTSLGYTIKATKDHKFLTTSGWATLEDAIGLKLVGEKAVMSKQCQFAVNGTPSIFQEEKENLNNLYWKENKSLQEVADIYQCSTHTIRKWLKIFNLQDKDGSKRQFSQGNTPWNKKVFGYKTKRRIKLIGVHKSRNLAKYKNTERVRIGSWTSKQLKTLLPTVNYCCQLCGNNEKLQTHHIVPVYMDKELAYNYNNLCVVCYTCHKKIHSSQDNELNFIETFTGQIIERAKKPVGSRRLKERFDKVVSIEYLGKEDVYDIEVVGPHHNFVANGIVVHNCSINTISGRYVQTADDWYQPNIFRQSAENVKQGSSDMPIDGNDAWIELYNDHYEECIGLYENMIEAGICREQARTVLPQGMNTEFYMSGSLQAFVHFIKLRTDSHAQKEIQGYGFAFKQLMEPLFPVSMKYLMNIT